MASAWPGACWLGKATAAACREFEVCFRSPRDLYSSESLWARRKLTTPGDTASVELWAVGVDEVHHTLSRFSPHAPPPIDFHAVLGVNLAAAPLLTGAASSSQARYLSKHLSGGEGETNAVTNQIAVDIVWVILVLRKGTIGKNLSNAHLPELPRQHFEVLYQLIPP